MFCDSFCRKAKASPALDYAAMSYLSAKSHRVELLVEHKVNASNGWMINFRLKYNKDHSCWSYIDLETDEIIAM